MNIVVWDISIERDGIGDRIFVGVENIRGRPDRILTDGVAFGQIFERGENRLAVAKLARQAIQVDCCIAQPDLALCQFADLIDQQKGCIIESRRSAARHSGIIENLGVARHRPRGVHQPRLDRGQWRVAV